MKVKLAKNYGFCFGVKRAIDIAEKNRSATTLGPLIHNTKEIDRLRKNFNVEVSENTFALPDNSNKVIIRTHGIPKNELEHLRSTNREIIDATCPFVTKPQEICEKMSKEGYQIVIFGDINHPEIKGVMSYSKTAPIVVLSIEELKKHKLSKKIALISQTTKNIDSFTAIADYIVQNCYESRIFNTICNATFENQESARELSKNVDVMIIVGGKESSNTKQLLNISKENCEDSYLIEDESDLDMGWFGDKKICGITAGASTPDWIIKNVEEKIKKI